ncbi:hypothetical protein OE88DRAFT_85319 [Heliocybe sulcata]|uniref:Uncharacterized protein n=1 Tax=Heliocybe sulcata TaxID=5364 RepID=A0A5C3NIC1_9AGAM|nr:hypothetical protein OE88DRAFT_85319 [Heliocybe sulcata]
MLKHAIPKHRSVAGTLGNIFQVAAGRAWTRHVQAQSRPTSRVIGCRRVGTVAPVIKLAVAGGTDSYGDTGENSPLVPSSSRHPDIPEPRRASPPEPQSCSSAPVPANGTAGNAVHGQLPSPSTSRGTRHSSSPASSTHAIAGCPHEHLSQMKARLSLVQAPGDGSCIVDTDFTSMPDGRHVPEGDRYVGTGESMHLPNADAGPVATLPSPSPPFPETTAHLQQRLLFLMHYTRPPSVLRLIDYHNSYYELQSARSFNLLLQHSIEHASYGTVPKLMYQMGMKRLEPNLETWKLWARWMVKIGRWQDAWDQVTAKTASIPLPVWLEFLGPTHARAFRKKDNETGRLVPAMSELQPSVEVEAARYDLLVQHWSKVDVTSHEHLLMQPYAIRMMVSSQLRSGMSSLAMQVTRSFLESLPSSLTDKDRSGCLDIIHQHIVHHPVKSVDMSAYTALREAIEELFTLRPELGLQPTSTTLSLLLRVVKRYRRCGSIADHITQRYKSRWTPSVVDERVRRRVASFARKEGRMDIVDRMLSEQDPGDAQRQALRLQESMLGGGKGDWTRYRRLLRSKWSKTLVRRRKGVRRWISLRRRLRAYRQ